MRVNYRMTMKITNLGKLPIEQKGKLPSDENKIKITKESSQVKKENSQSLKIIKIKGTNKHPTHNKCPSLNSI